MLGKLAIINHTLNGKKNEIAPKTLFDKKEKSGRQGLKNVY